MKFSVLLPTRNRLEYLRFAVESVLRQEYSDWEIVVSDNDSEDDVAGYVESLRDPRLIYVRTSTFVPVTENWNNALKHSSGDYVIMLGDDDGLLSGSLTRIHDAIERFEHPDVIYTGALLFVYPEVLRETPAGYLQAYGYASFLRGHSEPFVLEPEVARDVVQHSMNFRIRMGFNMQFAFVSRNAITRLQEFGAFYQSPFPDYYAMNALFLKCENIVAVPAPNVVIGMTKKSYGFYHYQGKDETAMAFLAAHPDRHVATVLEDVLLPGSNINNGWLFAMETLRHSLGLDRKSVNHRRYRHVQTMHLLRERYVTQTASDASLKALKARLSLWERILYTFIEHAAFRGGRHLAAFGKQFVFHAWRLLARHATFGPSTYLPWFAPQLEGQYQNILEVFEDVDPMDPRWLG